MADTFTTTTTQGYGSRIMNSISGIFLGIILVIVAIGLLYWNEGRVDLSTIAAQSKIIAADQVSTDPAVQGQLISTTGTLTADGAIGDNLFLKAGNYVSLSRVVEMYAWIETKKTTTTKNNGGSETTTTTYTYNQGWTTNPGKTSSFAEPAGHDNPALTIFSGSYRAPAAHIGAYTIGSIGSIELPTQTTVFVSKQNTILTGKEQIAGDQYIFIPAGTVSTTTEASPKIGDVRVSYRALNSGVPATVMGKLDGSSIDAYVSQNDATLYRAFSGSRDEAIAELHSEYEFMLWMFRLAGFMMIFMGFNLIARPISVVLDILPIFGEISSALISFISLILSVIVTLVVIVVSMLLHNLIALAIALIIVIVLVIVWFNHHKARAIAASASVTPPTV